MRGVRRNSYVDVMKRIEDIVNALARIGLKPRTNVLLKGVSGAEHSFPILIGDNGERLALVLHEGELDEPTALSILSSSLDAKARVIVICERAQPPLPELLRDMGVIVLESPRIEDILKAVEKLLQKRELYG